ncbi:MAG TPA: hypothetical protein DEP72_06960 [Clostridiales bacterium]|nr:MAG: hypothetical protein A2Y18_07935 [Clostridiales bacterium GWD2_32_19]HCC07880.1 hypothetical protein [Clostridiales bacterium]
MKMGVKIFFCFLFFAFSMSIAEYSHAAKVHKSDVILQLGDNRAYVDEKLVYIDETNNKVIPIIKNDRTLVPVRFVAEKYADEILWDSVSKKVTINSGKNQINIFIGSNVIYVNGKEKVIDTEAIIINDRTYLPLRAICEELGKYVFYNETGLIVISDNDKTLTSEDINYTRGLFSEPIKYEVVDYNKDKVSVIKINPKDPTINIEVSLPNDKLNNTADFLDIVSKKGAFAAINANFFNAYGTVKDPIGHVISDGKVVYGQSGLDSVFIMKDNSVAFVKPIIHVIGTTDGKADNVYLGNEKFDYHLWAAYGVNILEQDLYSAILYTEERGDTVNISCKGYVITVEDGFVKSNEFVEEAKEVIIPKGGNVIFIGADEAKLSMSAEAFKVGRSVEMKYRIFDDEGHEININDIKCAVSGGPTLVKNGEIVEGIPDSFSKDTRFTTAEARRTAIGVDKSGNIILIYTNKASITELKNISKILGCIDAINLDGGGSSAMYYGGKSIVSPSRKLATVLYIYN